MAAQHTILVPVINSQASLDAVAVACSIGKQRKSKVHVVHVIEVGRNMALNTEMQSEARRGEQLLRRAEDLGSHSGMHVTGGLLQAREAGQAIVDEARDRGVDAIILGLGRKPLIGDFHVGKTAQFVLRHAECEVWLVRQGTTHNASHTDRE